MRRIGRGFMGAQGLVVTLAVLSLLPGGCSHTQSSQEALDSQLKALNVTKADLAKFAGKVTVDGKSPTVPRGHVLLVVLYDKNHPDKNKPPLYTACRKDGSFEFYRYTAGDGAPVGSYVVLFAELRTSRQKGLVQPDALMNLYDDPDKNAQNKDFVIELASPGKSDYAFNLELAGKEAATTPGPHAITEIRKD